jgi:hypothetical protein
MFSSVQAMDIAILRGLSHHAPAGLPRCRPYRTAGIMGYYDHIYLYVVPTGLPIASNRVAEASHAR